MLKDHDHTAPFGPLQAVRGVIGGVLMGLANLVPGISGGTMLLAAGVYPQFINGVAEVSTFRFRMRSMLALACIVGAALAAIVSCAGPVGALVIDHRWIMYSIFIGLTLGGVPILHAMIRPVDVTVVLGAIAGIGLMVAMVLLGPDDSGGRAGDGHPYGMYLLAGLAGASAMVLPGVSGGYLLLVLGQYVTILLAIAALKDGLKARDWSAVMATGHVVIPVGIGVVAGVVGVSNLVKILLERFERATIGVLLGLLLGAVIGLWPFQAGVAPEPGASFRGDRVVMVDGVLHMESAERPIEPKDYPTAIFRPAAGQVAGALALIALGIATSLGIAHIGGTRNGGEG